MNYNKKAHRKRKGLHEGKMEDTESERERARERGREGESVGREKREPDKQGQHGESAT